MDPQRIKIPGENKKGILFPAKNWSAGNLVRLFLSGVLCCFPVLVQAQSQAPAPGAEGATNQDLSISRSSARINGTVIDPSGAAVAGARVNLASADSSKNQETLSDVEGHFTFADISSGAFQFRA